MLGIRERALYLAAHSKQPTQVLDRLLFAQTVQIVSLAKRPGEIPQLFSRRLMVKNRLHADTL
ncbi:hypothetical protein CCR96_15045 [Halochromatium roseum]|nr:hypothetical protein [Halochromatium roseum]